MLLCAAVALLAMAAPGLAAAGSEGVTSFTHLALPAVAPAPGSAGSVAGNCTEPLGPANYTGDVWLEAGPAPPSSVANLEVVSSFWIQENVTAGTPTGPVISTSCVLEGMGTWTNATGAFSMNESSDNTFCGQYPACVVTSGPYGANFSVAAAAPYGYLLATTVLGANVSMEYYPELAALALTPPTPSGTVSAGSPLTVTAPALNGLGQPTNVVPYYFWNFTDLPGAGWGHPHGDHGASATLRAPSGNSTVTVSVHAVYPGLPWTFRTPPVTLTLSSVATHLWATTLSARVVDVGDSVAVGAIGLGAAGNYTLSVTPGRSQPLVNGTCTDGHPDRRGTLVVSCRATIQYATPGVDEPSLVVSNGFSPATAELPNVTVDPLPVVVLSPVTATGYPDTPRTLTLRATPGFGTPPFRKACLDGGPGGLACQSGGGPNWTFTISYPSAGAYSVSGWVIDATGANASAATMVDVVDPPHLAAIVSSPAAPERGGPVTLSVNLSGGALPAEVWWNVSGERAPLAVASVGADGMVTANWTPPTTGGFYVVVTVEDALGTVTSSQCTISVGPGPVAALDVTTPVGTPVVAGTPWPMAWSAVDAFDDPEPSFAAAAVLWVDPPAGSDGVVAQANTSGGVNLEEVAPDAFSVPASAWSHGSLALSLTVDTSGSVALVLSEGPDALTATAVEVTVTPDLARLALTDPTVALSGSRDNHTLWHLVDLYGNPAFGASVTLETTWGTNVSTVPLVIERLPDGAAGVWVNFSAPTAAGGTVLVVGPGGVPLLPAITVPGAPPGGLPSGEVLLAVATTAAVGTGATLWFRSRREEPPARSPVPEATEDELREFAQGCARVLARVREVGPTDLAGIAGEWDPGPPPEGFDDWVSALLADGTLRAEPGPDGNARFLVGPEPPDLWPKVDVDATALDAALARRERLLADDGEPAAERE